MKHGNEITFMQICFEGLVDVNKDYSAGDTLLQRVAATWYFGLAECLITLAANDSAESIDRLIPLHIAARVGNSSMVKILLQHSRIDGRNGNGDTALHAAAESGNTSVLRVLIGAGANNGERNFEGQTALHVAVLGGFLNAVSVLLESGSSSNTAENYGYTALQSAVSIGDLEIIKLLLKAGRHRLKRRDRITPCSV